MTNRLRMMLSKKHILILTLMFGALLSGVTQAQRNGNLTPGDWQVTFYGAVASGSCPPALTERYDDYANLPIQLNDANNLLAVTDLSGRMGDFQFVADGAGHWTANDEGFLYDIVQVNPSRLHGTLSGNAFGCSMTIQILMTNVGTPAPLPPELGDLLSQHLADIPLAVDNETVFQPAYCEGDVIVLGMGDGTDVFLPIPEEMAHTIQQSLFTESELESRDSTPIEINRQGSIHLAPCQSTTTSYILDNIPTTTNPLPDMITPAIGDHTLVLLLRTPAQLRLLPVLGVPDASDELIGRLPILVSLPITFNAGDGNDGLTADFDGEDIDVIPLDATRSASELVRYGEHLHVTFDSLEDEYTIATLRLDAGPPDSGSLGSIYLDDYQAFRTLSSDG